MFLLSINCSLAQTPDSFNYQAVVRNSNGQLLTSQNIGVRINILMGSETGASVYSETHTEQTSNNGLLNLKIGDGDGPTTDFSAIDWGASNYYLKIEMDKAGGTNYTLLGASQLLSVPYALYAKAATNLGDDKVYTTSSDTLFVVKDHDGNVVFVVFPDGAQVIVNEEGKGRIGGFAVSGRNPTKDDNSDYFNITSGTVADTINNEPRMIWYPKKAAFLAGEVHVGSADSVGTNSTALGYRPIAMGNYSQAFGYESKALNLFTTAIGKYAIASGQSSYAFGDRAKSIGMESFAFGFGTEAHGFNSYAFGSSGVDSSGTATGNTKAIGDYSFAFGLGSVSDGSGSLAFGLEDSTKKDFSIAIGYKNIADGYGAQSIGYKSNSTGDFSITIGKDNNVTGEYGLAIGSMNEAVKYSGAIGRNNKATDDSYAIGINNIASGYSSFAIGSSSIASGQNSLATNARTIASGAYAVSMGDHTESSGNYSFAMGFESEASGNVSVAFGSETTASGDYSVAFGRQMVAQGDFSFAIGLASLTDTVSQANTMSIMGGRVGIGTVAPSQLLEVDNGTSVGTYTTTGWQHSSDRRLKTNINSINGALKLVSQLDGVYFNWKNNLEEKQVGFIAQDVEKVLPEVVSKNQEGYYNIAYGNVTPVIVEAIKEQQQIIEGQQKEISELKTRLAEIEKLLKKE